MMILKCYICNKSLRQWRVWRSALCYKHKQEINRRESRAIQEQLPRCTKHGHDWRLFTDGSKKGIFERCMRCHFIIPSHEVSKNVLFEPYAFFQSSNVFVYRLLKKTFRVRLTMRLHQHRIIGTSEKERAANVLYHLRYDLGMSDRDIENKYKLPPAFLNSLIYAFPWYPQKNISGNTINTKRQREAIISRIFLRDDKMCLNCKTSKRGLVIHHKNNNEQDYSESNLITVCKICHMAYLKSKKKEKYTLFYK